MKVLKFYADWCQPCKMLSAVIADLDIKTPIEEVDIDNNQELAVKYGVRGIPTCILLDDNDVEIKRQSGTMMANEFKAFVGE